MKLKKRMLASRFAKSLRKSACAVTGFVVLLLFAGVGYSQANLAAQWSATGLTNAREIVSPLATAAPVIDGDLSDAIWKDAPRVGGFFRAKSAQPAEEKTVVAVTHSADTLYFAFAVADKTIVAKERQRDQGTYQDDCVEVFLDPERGHKDRFHFIISAAGMVYDAKLDDAKWNAEPDIKVAVKQQPGWGWTAELAIPFNALVEKPPVRGDVWDLKLAREDYQSDGSMPTLSSWQSTDASFSDAGAFGQLIFANRNLDTTGDFSQGLRTNEFFSGGWRICSKENPDALTLATDAGHDAPPCGKVTFEKYVQVQHLVPVKAGRNFRISAWVNLDGMTGGKVVEFYTEPNTKVRADAKRKGWQRLETYCSSGPGKVVIMLLASHSSGGSYLVDDAAVEEVENTPRDTDAVCYTGNASGEQERHNRKVDGRYTYCELGTEAAFFPQTVERGEGDVAEFYGWIPFAKGKLTDGKSSFSKYHEWTKTPGKTILMDLGADRYVTDLEIEPVQAGIKNVRLYVKPDKAPHYTLAAIPELRGGSVEIKGINAHLRFLRIDSDGICGLREIRIWGKDQSGAIAPKPFVLAASKDAPNGIGGPVLAASVFSIFPTPKEFTQQTSRLKLGNEVKLGIPADAAEGIQGTAEDLAARLRFITGLKVEIVKGAEAPIRLGMAKTENGAEDKGSQGYRLTITDTGVEVVGGGEDGLFYGCQTLLQCLVPVEGGFALRAVTVRDWPSYPLRMIEVWPKQFATGDSVVRILETFARLKMSHILMMGMENPALPVSQRMAKMHMETVIRCLSMPNNESWPQLEMNPGETRQSLPKGRVNPCPSDPKNQAYMDQEIAKAAKFPGKYAYLICDEMYQEHAGARWNACPLCTARKLPGGELYREFIQTIYDKLAKVGKKPMMLDTVYCIPYKGMNEAFTKLPKDIPIIIWHPVVQKGLTELGYSVGEFFDKDEWSIDPAGKNVLGGFIPADGGFKIERSAVLAEAFWSGKYPDLSDPAVLKRLSDVMVQVHEAIIDAPLPSLTARPEALLPLDLSAAANASLADEIAGDGKGFLDLGPGTDLSFMRGKHTLNGVPFLVGGKDGKDFVAMDNRGSLDPVFPPEVRVPIGHKAASLVFLHTLSQALAWSYAAQLTYAGAYLIEYADGTRLDFPIEYKQNILEYNALDASAGGGYKSRLVTLPCATPAYKGTMPGGGSILLLSAEWVNPYPQKEIAAVILRSTSRQFGTRVALFALTAVQPTGREESFWSARPRNAYQAPAAVALPANLKEINLAGGEIKPDADYVAPDGTRISATKCYTLIGATFITHMHPGLVTVDNNIGWQVYGTKPDTLTLTFPAERKVAAVSLLGLPQTPEYTFGGLSPAPMDYTIEGSADGATWAPLGARTAYLADRDWESNHVFEPRNLKALRIIVKPTAAKGSPVRGLAWVKIFAPTEK